MPWPLYYATHSRVFSAYTRTHTHAHVHTQQCFIYSNIITYLIRLHVQYATSKTQIWVYCVTVCSVPCWMCVQCCFKTKQITQHSCQFVAYVLWGCQCESISVIHMGVSVSYIWEYQCYTYESIHMGVSVSYIWECRCHTYRECQFHTHGGVSVRKSHMCLLT